ncbi:hypothetical protein ACFL6Y_07410 [Elusimicrobiota bacterium]
MESSEEFDNFLSDVKKELDGLKKEEPAQADPLKSLGEEIEGLSKKSEADKESPKKETQPPGEKPAPATLGQIIKPRIPATPQPTSQPPTQTPPPAAKPPQAAPPPQAPPPPAPKPPQAAPPPVPKPPAPASAPSPKKMPEVTIDGKKVPVLMFCGICSPTCKDDFQKKLIIPLQALTKKVPKKTFILQDSLHISLGQAQPQDLLSDPAFEQIKVILALARDKAEAQKIEAFLAHITEKRFIPTILVELADLDNRSTFIDMMLTLTTEC